jgi:signal transduction histidine kinase
MQERAGMVGGRLELSGREGGGTQVRLEVPLEVAREVPLEVAREVPREGSGG